MKLKMKIKENKIRRFAAGKISDFALGLACPKTRTQKKPKALVLAI